MSKSIAHKAETPGAIESNAGDDYHILWACRQALKLLEPGSGLSLLHVEGVSRIDEASASDKDAFLGVDLTEYYGGSSFNDASRIVFSQLKYSQRHPNKSWTAARLCEKLEGKTDRSVIARLAQAFKGFYDAHSRDAVIERLCIKLVSNRPADDELVEALKAVKNILSGKAAVQASRLISAIPEKNQDVIKRFQTASALKSAMFCDFLRCLDFSDCGSDSRLWQRLRLVQTIGQVSSSPVEQCRDLYALLASEALPKVGVSGLKKEDILAALGCHSNEHLFPAPPRFEILVDPIFTPDASRICDDLKSSPTRSLLAHGAGGVGKTTTILSLPNIWPSGRWIFYDCFGGGTYIDSPGDERHSVRRALVQLSNELAVQCGSPFLIRPSEGIDDLWREFRTRLEAAANILKANDESLILVIDAADNSIQAADTPEDSFVVYLWKVKLPENVFLLMTARTGGRADSLQSPPDTPRTELTGFSLEASTQHLLRILPLATGEDAKVFHNNSHGNPRVQNYALNVDGSQTIPSVLELAHRKLNEIFQDYIQAALTLSFAKGSGSASDYLNDLSCFPRPLRLHHLMEVFGLSDVDVRKLCDSLSPGLTSDGDGWKFRDEDFDTFLRERLEKIGIQATYRRLANRMGMLPESDFASRHYAEYLFGAEADAEVVELALRGNAAIPNSMDEVAQVQVLRRRLVLGVKAAARMKQSQSLVRLTIKAADAARSNYAILELIEEHPDLAALYADPNTIAKHYLNAKNQGWFGGAQLRCAALFSRYPEHHVRAREHLSMAEAWIRRWISLSREERGGNNWNIKDGDIAAGVEAIFRLNGPVAASNWLKRWRPLDSVLHACQLLAKAIAREVSVPQQTEFYELIKPHPLAAVLFLVEFNRAGFRPELSLIEKVLSAVEAYSRLNRHYFLRDHKSYDSESSTLQAAIGIEFAELLADVNIDPNRIVCLLKRFSPIKANYAPHNAFDSGKFSRQLRILALLAELNGVEPNEKDLEQQLLMFGEKTSESERKEECRRFHNAVDARFKLYRLRAEALFRHPDIADLLPRLTEVIHRNPDESWRYGQDFNYYLRDALHPLIDVALVCTGNTNEFLNALTETIAEKFGAGAPTFWINVAGRLLVQTVHVQNGLRLIDRAVKYLSENPTNGKEHCAELLRAATLVQPHDSGFGAGLFHQAVNIAKELNDDLRDRLRYLARSTEALNNNLTEIEARDLSARLARLTEETQIYVANEDGYPWEQVFYSILNLHTPSGHALLTRWDDLGYLGVRSDIKELSKICLKNGKLTSNHALGLLRLGWTGRGPTNRFLSILEKTLTRSGIQSKSFRSQLQNIINWAIRDVGRDGRADCATRIHNWLTSKNADHLPEVKPLQKYIAFIESDSFQKKSQSYQQENHLTAQAEHKPVDWDSFFGNAPIPLRLLELLAGLNKLPGYQRRSTFYAQARQRIGPSDRIAYMQALLELPHKRVDAYDYLDEWEACLTEWSYSAQVKQWAMVNTQEMVRRHLPIIIGYPYELDKQLSRLLKLPFVKPERWLDLLAPALADWVERLGAWQLYPLAGVLARGLTADQQKELLDEAITHGELAIEERQQKSLPPMPDWQIYGDDNSKPFASFLFTLLGHPDTRIRWSCLHALREMNLQEDPDLLTALVEQLNVEDVAGYLPADSSFMWMSARSYLMIFFARFAVDHPDSLLPYLQPLVSHALSKDFPHVQIRELAKNAVLSVAKKFPDSLSEEIRRQLSMVNVPIEVQHKEDGSYHLSDGRNHDGRFNFSSLDTLPHWFSPLGQRFHLGGGDIAILAESWICDRWGYLGRYPHKSRKNRDRDWSLRTNDHGALPTIEEGRVYLEYHAMLLVAGELIDSRPVMLEYPDSDYDSWQSWLKNHLPTRSDFWLSELRDPVPQEEKFSGLDRYPGSWVEPPVPEAFDAYLGLITDGGNKFLIVAASVDIHDSRREEHHRIESALVDPQSAHALLRALQVINDPHPYRIPPAGHDLEIDEPGFALKGWIGESSGEKEFDNHDPLLFGMYSNFPVFPSEVQSNLNIRRDAKGKRYYDRLDPGQLIAAVTAWSDLHEDKEGAEYSRGWRLQIRCDRLLSYLQAQQRCLIIEVQINRKEQQYGKEENFGYKSPSVLIYLLHPNGRLETLEHHYSIGSENT